MRDVLYCTKLDSSPRGRPPLTKMHQQINDSVFLFLQSPSTCTLNIMRIVELTERANCRNVPQIVPMSRTQTHAKAMSITNGGCRPGPTPWVEHGM
ncbi:hypothetical protein MRX96_008351 [Rhipicephalus microplus]